MMKLEVIPIPLFVMAEQSLSNLGIALTVRLPKHLKYLAVTKGLQFQVIVLLNLPYLMGYLLELYQLS